MKKRVTTTARKGKASRKRAAGKPSKKSAPSQKPVVKKAAKPKPKPKAKAKAPGASRWVKLVEKHGILLASARGPVLNVADLVVGEPIVGGWWAHAKGKTIFAALSEIDASKDIRCFRLLDGKVTFAHRRVWAALVRLVRAGEIEADRLGAVQQVHAPTGEHHNIVVPFPDWVDAATSKAADALDLADARGVLPHPYE